MHRAISIAVLAALCLVFAGTRAEAQKKPSSSEMEKAKEHYTRAQAYLDLKEYQKAAEEFLAAHALFPDPEFYFNVAEAYRLDGKRELALEYYKKYLKEAPNGRVARLAAATVAEIEAAVSEERRKADEEARRKADEEARRKADDEARRKADEEARRKADDEARRKADEETRRKAEAQASVTNAGSRPEGRDGSGGSIAKPRRSRPGRGLRIAGLSAAGAGLIAVALGVKFGLDARSLSDEVSGIGDGAGDQWTDDNLDKIDRGESAESKMFLFTGLGATAIVAGGVLYFLGNRKDARAADSGTVALTPSFSSGAAGIALTGNF